MADKRKTNSEKNPPTWKIQNFSRIFNSACDCVRCAYIIYSKADRTCS